MSDFVRFFAEGTPRPAGSKFSQPITKKGEGGRRVPVMDPNTGNQKTITRDASGKKGEAWRKTIKEAARPAMAGMEPFEGPLRVSLVFYMRRPQAHYGSGANADVLRPDAPSWHTFRPDVDKLSRAVLDALKGVCWNDDAQVCFKLALKPYADRHLGQQEGVEIAVQTLSRNEAPPDERAQMELMP